MNNKQNIDYLPRIEHSYTFFTTDSSIRKSIRWYIYIYFFLLIKFVLSYRYIAWNIFVYCRCAYLLFWLELSNICPWIWSRVFVRSTGNVTKHITYWIILNIDQAITWFGNAWSETTKHKRSPVKHIISSRNNWDHWIVLSFCFLFY